MGIRSGITAESNMALTIDRIEADAMCSHFLTQNRITYCQPSKHHSLFCMSLSGAEKLTRKGMRYGEVSQCCPESL